MYLLVRKLLIACALVICAFWIGELAVGDGEPILGGGDLAGDLGQLGAGQIGLQFQSSCRRLVAAHRGRHAGRLR